MTAPNLTPAEALAMFKDWKDSDLTIYDFCDKWYVSHDPDSFALIAIAALETLLSEHEATKAKLAATDREYLNFTVLVHERLKQMAPEADGNTGKLFDYVEKRLAAYEAKAQEPAAAVKRGRHRIRQLLVKALNDGDEEATAMLQQALLWRVRQPVAGEKLPSDEEITTAIAKTCAHSFNALSLMAKRIGVKL